jgi:uracil-DNA glycosylase
MPVDLLLMKRVPVPDNTPLVDIVPPNWANAHINARPELELVDKILKGIPGVTLPPRHMIFRALDICPSHVKVMIIGQDPYHSLYKGKSQATGLAFSTNPDCPMQPSVRNIFTELQDEYPELSFDRKGLGGCLDGWATQGVLMLNTCLTVRQGVPKSHKKIWRGYVSKIMDAVNEANPQVIKVAWGRSAQDFVKMSRSTVLTSSHPSPLSANKAMRDAPAFMGCGHFRQVNELLKARGEKPIVWTK